MEGAFGCLLGLLSNPGRVCGIPDSLGPEAGSSRLVCGHLNHARAQERCDRLKIEQRAEDSLWLFPSVYLSNKAKIGSVSSCPIHTIHPHLQCRYVSSQPSFYSLSIRATLRDGVSKRTWRPSLLLGCPDEGTKEHGCPMWRQEPQLSFGCMPVAALHIQTGLYMFSE